MMAAKTSDRQLGSGWWLLPSISIGTGIWALIGVALI